MHERIEIILPPNGNGARAFADFKTMFCGSMATITHDSITFSAGADLNPATMFRLGKASFARKIPGLGRILDLFKSPLLQIAFVGDYLRSALPDGLFDMRKGKSDPSPLSRVAQELSGKILYLECSGLSVQPTIDPAAWAAGVVRFSSGMRVKEHPAVDGYYDPAKQMWLYGFPVTQNEYSFKLMSQEQRHRQPMFSLVCDKDIPDRAVLCLDVRTRITMDEIINMYPESSTLPNCEDLFRILDLRSDIPGIPVIRLFLRPGSDTPPPVNVWRSAAILNSGPNVSPRSGHTDIRHLIPPPQRPEGYLSLKAQLTGPYT